eukprot:286810-Prymnesium_polylepis.1
MLGALAPLPLRDPSPHCAALPPAGPCWSPRWALLLAGRPVGPCCLGHRAARTLTVVVRVYEMLRLSAWR